MTYIDTYYSRTLADPVRRAGLSGTIETDCAVVGAGLAGLTTALELQRRGVSTVVLEAERVGHGASGRNGGFVSAGFGVGEARLTARTSAADAATLRAMAADGRDYVRRTIDELGIAGAEPVDAGMMHLRRFDRGGDLRAEAEASGGAVEYLDRRAIRELLASDRYYHGLWDRRGFHIHPPNYLRGLARRVEALGGRIFEGSRIIETRLDRPEKELRSRTGSVRARKVVLATGGYTGRLVPRLRRAILPIATYVMVTEPAPELLARTIRTRRAIFDDRLAGDYYRLVDGGRRLLWGGRISTLEASPQSITRQLRREMLTVYPDLAPLETEIAWSGLMAYARHLMPAIGKTQPGVWHACAFGGHGLNTTAMAGLVLAEAISGESERIRLFAPFGLEWAGGAAGLGVAQLTYWRLRAQDWWRER